MTFLTLNWLFLMFGTAAVHWALPSHSRNIFIILVTGAFLGYADPTSLLYLGALTLILYGAAGRATHINLAKTLILIGITMALLFTYKGLASFSGAGFTLGQAGGFLIPLGLSYYTLRCVHYLIEKYKGAIPAHSFLDFASYLFFLPTLIIGPIHRFQPYQQDLTRKRWDGYLFAEGVERILFGYVKIMFIAALVIGDLYNAFVLHTQSWDVPYLTAYLRMWYVGLHLYFMFSGASDIAIGFARMLGFKVMENFNHPFFKTNISRFWQSWHISLTSWCRDYIYMGVISLSRNPMAAALASMLVLGLWHEFSWRYVAWGVYHGLGIIIWQKFQWVKAALPQTENKVLKRLWAVVSWALTIHFVLFGFFMVSQYWSQAMLFVEVFL